MVRSLAQIVLLVIATIGLVNVAGPASAGAKKADTHMANELAKVNHELARANAVYFGHRGNAMDGIADAIHQLGGNTKYKKPAENPKKDLPQKKSDDILIHAIKQLTHVQAELAKVTNSASHANAANDVRYAISQLEIALMLR